ncbi:MAG: DNA recombination protein RmuC [Xanthomonadales bacterium]|jgi:DNA recombination protein RmuC|nr:DNA recombination protein RmuC [Xanthomonadales bacterium]
MNEWLIQQGIANPQMGLFLGLGIGLFIMVIVAMLLSRRSAVLETRLSDREQHYSEQIEKLEQAETRLAENFERLAGRIFEDRSEKLSDLNTKQLDGLLKPLSDKLTEFRSTVETAHRLETAQHQVMKEKIGDLEKLNERLHEDATNLSRALTSNVKAQGNWGEQQLERLLELAGLQKDVEYSTQVSVTTESGQRLQPDLVLHLPEGKSIVLDSKVSLVAWTRYQACGADDAARAAALKEHVQSIRQHIKGLSDKRYAEAPELHALDFVLMFVPIEAALIAALQAEPELAEFALRNKVALIAPTNFLATMRTVASVWSVHKQNSNAQEIARRAGLMYDKFAGFVENLQAVGDRLRQAQQSYDKAFGQLSGGAGSLLRQTEQLRELGARNTKRLDIGLLDKMRIESPENPADCDDVESR